MVLLNHQPVQQRLSAAQASSDLRIQQLLGQIPSAEEGTLSYAMHPILAAAGDPAFCNTGPDTALWQQAPQRDSAIDDHWLTSRIVA